MEKVAEVENKDLVVTLVENTEEFGREAETLSETELELAKKHGIDVSKVINEEETAEKLAEKPIVEDKKTDDIPVEDLDSFEKLHDIYQSKPEAFYKLPRNIKQLYHSQKGLYKRMKDEEEKRKKFEDDAGLRKIQDSVARIKLDRIKTRLANPEGLTVEELSELLDEKKEVQDSKDKPLTMKDIEAMKEAERKAEEEQSDINREKQATVARRIEGAEAIAKGSISDITGGKYTDFNDVVALAQEMVKSKSRYGEQIASVINGDSDIQEIVDVLVDVARLNPKWGTSVNTGKKDDKSVDRIVKNAGKQQTSATLAGGRGSREVHISEDMDPEEAARVWDKIPRNIKSKILLKLKD